MVHKVCAGHADDHCMATTLPQVAHSRLAFTGATGRWTGVQNSAPNQKRNCKQPIAASWRVQAQEGSN